MGIRCSPSASNPLEGAAETTARRLLLAGAGRIRWRSQREARRPAVLGRDLPRRAHTPLWARLLFFLPELLAERDERLELGAGGAAVDGLRGQPRALLQVAGPAARHQRGRGVHQDDVALGSRLAVEDPPDDLGVLLAVAPLEVGAGRPGQAEVLRPQRDRAHHALPDLGDAAVAGVRDLVEPVGAVHDEGTPRAQLRQPPR